MRHILLFILVLGLAACTSDAPTPETRFASPGNSWQAEEAGVLRHAPSGIGFPENIGDYKRTKVTDFTDDGTDVGVTYFNETLRQGRFEGEITLYATYYEGVTAQQYLDSASQAIVDRFKGITLVQEGDFIPEGGKPIVGPYRLFQTRIDQTDIRTGVWVATDGNWLLKARFTYPGKGDEAMAMIAKLLNAEMAKSGFTKTVRVTGQTKEGIPAEMDHVAAALKAVMWPDR